MTAIVDFVQATSLELTPSELRLPPLIWSAISAINRIHRLWRWYRKANTYANPDHLVHLFAGHTMTYVLGDNVMIKIAAQCLLVATRLLECAQQQTIVYQDGKKLIAEIYGRYPNIVEIKWTKQTKHLSPSTMYRLEYAQAHVRQRIRRIVLAVITFFQSISKLTMTLMDTIDAFYLSQSDRDGINESFVNLAKWIDTAVDHKEALLQGLSQNQKLIEKILSHSPLKYDQLYRAVANTLEKTERLHRHVKKASSFANGLLVETGKRAINTGMIVTGLA